MLVRTINPTIKGVKEKHFGLRNAVVIGPDDDLAAAYDWLKSGDRDAVMGALSFTTPRTLFLAPGTHTLTERKDLDISYVNLCALSSNRKDTVITGTFDDYIVQQTCACVQIANLTFMATATSKAGFCINHTHTGTAASSATVSVVYRKLTETGIGQGVLVGDEIAIWGGDTPITGRWATIVEVYDDDNVKIKTTFTNTTNISWEYAPQNSLYINLYFDSSNASLVYAIRSGITALSHIGGRWFNILMGNYCLAGNGSGDYVRCRGVFEFIRGGIKCFGFDDRGNGIDGTIRYFEFGQYSLGGCGQFGCDISGTLEFGVTGDDSLAKGRAISGTIRNVTAGTLSFASYHSTPDVTGATGTDASPSVITKAGGFTSSNWYGQHNGRAGMTVYISGTNCTSGWYEVATVTDDTLTLTANASSGGAMSSLTIRPCTGLISGLIENCVASGNSFGMGLAQSRITGTVRNCRNGTVAGYQAGTSGGAATTFTGISQNNKPWQRTSATAATTVREFDNGQTYDNTGASASVTFTLPTAVVGLKYTFVRTVATAAADVIVDPQAADVIVKNDGVAMAAGESYQNVADAWGEIDVECRIAGYWHITRIIGTWVEETPP